MARSSSKQSRSPLTSASQHTTSARLTIGNRTFGIPLRGALRESRAARKHTRKSRGKNDGQSQAPLPSGIENAMTAKSPVNRRTPILSLDIPTSGALALQDNGPNRMPRLGNIARFVLESGGWDGVSRILKERLNDRDSDIVLNKLQQYVELLQVKKATSASHRPPRKAKRKIQYIVEIVETPTTNDVVAEAKPSVADTEVAAEPLAAVG